jgi:hypothetical protein
MIIALFVVAGVAVGGFAVGFLSGWNYAEHLDRLRHAYRDHDEDWKGDWS